MTVTVMAILLSADDFGGGDSSGTLKSTMSDEIDDWVDLRQRCWFALHYRS